MSIEEIVREAKSLSAEKQAELLDLLLVAMHRSNPENDNRWADVAESRLHEFRSGTAKTVSGEEVLAKLRRRR